MTHVLKRTIDFFSSYAFAVVILFLLLVLTLFGTLEQVEHGLYEVQKKYFESFFLVHQAGPIPIPLPGVYLLMVLLFVNLVCGAIIRAPREWRRPGMLIAHGGIIFMLVAGFVTYEFSHSGHMTLFENDSASHFDSYYDWEIQIVDLAPGGQKHTITGDHFQKLEPGEQRTFFADALPFELTIREWMPNATPMFAPMAPGTVDGVLLQSIPLEKEAERNLAGGLVDITPKDGGEPVPGVLWGFSTAPWKINFGGKDYAIALRHKRYPVPFTITLDKFIHELHPRTGMASNFESEVTMTENGQPREISIRMNEPLRHEGYTLFQASWGPQDARPGEPLFSTFAVVNNPADQWPLYSCLVIAAGLLIHFLQKLSGYIRAENRRRA